ncbi:MAG: phosphoribosylaminoimidazolesuccinocarboxamide synthase [Oscillospiraceae bacterium]|nr:phosphoribosylaminoimidazolesuccinocarboxamide synthase [Oscillospiraceae bacterium]
MNMCEVTEILYEGKSKILYRCKDEVLILVKYKDSVTAFNGEKSDELFGKGRLNAAISNLIYEYLEVNGIKTHLVKVIDESSVLVKKAEIIPAEVIVRNVAAGSFSKKYGVDEGVALPHPTVEFSLKSDTLGDPLINVSHITALGLATSAELEEMKRLSLLINELLSGLFQKAGIRLIDFKLEFGRAAESGELLLCDEISPDSCRLWQIGTDCKLDKDRYRRDLGGVLDSYEEVLRRLQGVEL